MFIDIDIVIDGERINVNIEKDLKIINISEDMDMVSSQIAYWGAVWAAAEEEELKAKAYYRNWKAKIGEKLTNADNKLAEWKIRQKLEALDEFHTIKQGLSMAAKNVLLARTVFESFKAKASMLQSKGAMMRSELDSTSMRTKSTSAKEIERTKNREALKKVLKTSRRK
jgi:hypothetical protein